MREMIRDAYPGPAWKDRVSRMPDDQVIAVYYNFLRSGKFNPKPYADTKTKLPKTEYRQMTLFDNEFINKIWG